MKITNKNCIDCGKDFYAEFDCQQRCPKCRKKYFKANPDKKKIANTFIKKRRIDEKMNVTMDKITRKIAKINPCPEGEKRKIGW